MSTIIDRLEIELTSPHVAVIFVYCNYKDRNGQTFVALLASLVQQLVECSDSIPEDVRLLFEQCRSKKTLPNLGQLAALFSSRVANSISMYIVVDGLDECSEIDETRGQSTELLNSQPAQVKVLCTSRRLGDIEEGFRTAFRLEVRASREDIELFVRSQILGSDRHLSFCEASEQL